jgi:hypothetical protein
MYEPFVGAAKRVLPPGAKNLHEMYLRGEPAQVGPKLVSHAVKAYRPIPEAGRECSLSNCA